ncbi:MotA/TolQ/ExbB proton channel family protein [Desulfatibacillum aliphaticivorans]|uniref:MotA/TolQ/ExbB proton channel family protein n=1 Tax=Desulfatibacillum aliphaticivorans TaxID=218208 RepID=UPI00042A7B23|nr:MotA/TolQ/ExbB proton channel family protein [Desulfatibacillum aliphaticivorans]
MKIIKSAAVILILVLLCIPAFGQDMRARSVEAQRQKAMLEQRALEEKQAAQKEAREALAKIVNDRQAAKAAIAELNQKNSETEENIADLQKRISELEAQKAALKQELSNMDAQTRTLVGHVRSNARDALALVKQSQQSALIPGRADALKELAGQSRFPSIEQIDAMAEILLDEIARSGEVRIEKASIVDRLGREAVADVLTLGEFTAAYSMGDETGFLLYSDASQRFFALSKLPSSKYRKALRAYMNGESPVAPMDLTKGAALRQLTQEKGLAERLPQGGPIIWVILALGGFAMLLVLERVVFLLRIRVNASKLMAQIQPLAQNGDWKECLDLLKAQKSKPLARVLAWGIKHRHLERMDMENALQEAILGEIPALERFLSIIAMMAAVAPLLGLLGTVTGMINTFHVITYYGAGDPKMMSGGISEALLTTMLGLAAAIPIMLAHTLLSRRIEGSIAQMEEKAVSLANTIYAVREKE